MWEMLCGFCRCDCITSHRDALVLHSLSPSLVIKDGIDLVDVLGKRRRIQTGSEPQWFLLSGNHEPPLLSGRFLFPLCCYILALMSLKNRDYGLIVKVN